MITGYKFIFVKKSRTNTTTVGNSQAIFKNSYAAFITDESIYTIIK